MGDERFDVVVVGSGFGGAVMAYRLAERELSVCVLERGQEFPRGSFPRSVHGMSDSVWDPSRQLHGMWNAWSFSRFDAFVASGLGGGSLVYGNVLLRKPAEWFVTRRPGGSVEPWPVGRADLDPHYDRVEAMLQAQSYPMDHAPYAQVRKVRAFHDAARAAGLEPTLPLLSIFFADPARPGAPVPGAPLDSLAPDLHGLPRTTCTLCGECVFGCNVGAKNSLDYNYLSRARLDHGADLRPLHELVAFAPAGGGWTLTVRQRLPGRTPRSRDFTMWAKRLVLAAGAFGTPFLLLDAKRRGFISPSAALGTGLTGNGDLFCVVGGASKGGEPLDLEPGRGPAITSAATVPFDRDRPGGPGFVVEEAIGPDFLSWMSEFVWTPSVIGRALRFAWEWIRSRGKDPDMGEEVSRLLGGGRASMSTLPILAMGMDIPTGKMALSTKNSRRLAIDWDLGPNEAYFGQIRAQIEAIAANLGGELKFSTTGLRRTFTVHPLGGCPMGRAGRGAVDEWGRVLDDHGAPIPGLHVADGSVMPGPVGPNPSLTISALADRFAEQLLRDEGRL
jgi:cholesterol oxidase